MGREEDFSLEDNKEVMNHFSTSALSEFESLKEQLKREHRRDQLLYLRSMRVKERKEFKAKHGIK